MIALAGGARSGVPLLDFCSGRIPTFSVLHPISMIRAHASPWGTIDRGTALAFEAALLVLAFALPFEIIHPLVRVGSWFELTNLELLVGGTAIAWAFRIVATRRRPDLRSPLTILVLAFLLIALVSAVLAPSHRFEALKFTTRFATGIYVFFLIVAAIDSRERFERLIGVILIAGLLSAALGIVEALQGGSGPLFGLFKAGPTRVGGQLRVSATFQYATIASMYFEMVVPLMLGAVLAARRRGVKLLLAAGMVLFIEVVVLTLTRSGLLALGAAFLVVAALAWLKPSQRGATVLALGGLLVMALLLGATAAVNRTVITRLQTENAANWYGATYRVPERLVAEAGELITVPVEVQNTGEADWLAVGDHSYVLSYHWLTADGSQELDFPRVETELPHDVAPGESVQLEATVRVVPDGGNYLLAWGMLQREILWFSQAGIPDAYTWVEVSSSGGIQATPVPAAPRDQTVYVKPPVRRLELWAAALRMIARHPLLGVGPDNFRHVFGEYAGRSEWDENVHANNMYLEMVATLGLPGGLLFFTILGLAAALLARAWRAAPPGRFLIWLFALAGSLTAFLVHGLLDYFLEFAGLYLFFWMLLGLIVAADRLVTPSGLR